MAGTPPDYASSHSAKSGSRYEDPPMLMATPLPTASASSLQRVIIDEYDDLVALETTPLVAVYSSSINDDNHPLPTEDDDDLQKDEPEVLFRDWLFGLFFYLQFALFVLCTNIFSPRGYERIDKFLNYTLIRESILAQSDDTVTTENWEELDAFITQAGEYLDVHAVRILIWSVIPSALLGVVWVHMTVFILPYISYGVVTTCLASTLVLSVGILVAWVAMTPSIGSLMIAGFLCGMIIYYVHLVWPMIPFAAVNLKAAAKGINANMGTHIWAFGSSMLGVVWLLFWLWGTFGIMAYLDNQCDAKYGVDDADESFLHNTTHRWLKAKKVEEHENVPSCGQGGIFMLLLLSNYWTYLVLMVRAAMYISVCDFKVS
jgi:Plasma-membrane choline transporter